MEAFFQNLPKKFGINVMDSNKMGILFHTATVATKNIAVFPIIHLQKFMNFKIAVCNTP
jgi:hypothetical protein